jgi:hypothetical protein
METYHEIAAGEREAREEGDLPMPEAVPVEDNWEAGWEAMGRQDGEED